MQKLEINNTGTSNTITTVQKDNYLIEFCGIIEQPNDRFYNKKGIARTTHYDTLTNLSYTLRTIGGHAMVGIPKENPDTSGEKIKTSNLTYSELQQNYKVRKLTPLECWRLMGQKDADFEKCRAIHSDSALYKQAGNSIVVDVLEQIFKQLF